MFFFFFLGFIEKITRMLEFIKLYEQIPLDFFSHNLQKLFIDLLLFTAPKIILNLKVLGKSVGLYGESPVIISTQTETY